MQSFSIHTFLGGAMIPMSVRQLGSITEDDLMEHEVSYDNDGEALHCVLTLDVSKWYPPMYLGEPHPPMHVPEVFVFCPDGQFNYREAQAIGQAIMRHYDAGIHAESKRERDLFGPQE
ncbi:hypothetical protein [Mucilaginibacter terrae]|uniref:Uncharacterized protein n=1 Tax=Mucilaginibacter terrae TaxID=1955052 RepID=A0ABU3GQW5_9SPHI|nr:hypothetical protein [Mucilaginibacter terrae]MDT3401347.1 hypothetical protein [Mucilaginibacter terrae]